MATVRQEIKSAPSSSVGIIKSCRSSIPFVDSYCLSPAENKRIYLSKDKTHIEILNLDNGDLISLDARYEVKAMALSIQGDFLVITNGQNLTRWKNITSKEPQLEDVKLTSEVTSKITDIYFSEDNVLMTAHLNGCIFSWNLESGIATQKTKVESTYLNEIPLKIDEKWNSTSRFSRGELGAIVYSWNKSGKLIGKLDLDMSLEKWLVKIAEDKFAWTWAHNSRQLWIQGLPHNVMDLIDTTSNINSLSLNRDGLIVAVEKDNLIEFFNPISAMKVTQIQIPGIQDHILFWNSWGHVTSFGLSEYAIMDFKCDIKTAFMTELLGTGMSKDPCGVVLEFLFFSKPDKKMDDAEQSCQITAVHP